MNFYLAPLEGITGYIFRNALHEYFGTGIDKCYTPFLTPHEKRAFSSKELNEISLENNKTVNLVPQILTANAEDFTRLANVLRDMGYTEINLNLGCPSKTVANKGRGSGALRDTLWLDDFLAHIFENGDKDISVKTRLGIESPEEFEEIFEIYQKYPIYELTIHPRVMKEVYSGRPHRDIFAKCIYNSSLPICYNGDICSVEDYNAFMCELSREAGEEPDNMNGVLIGKAPDNLSGVMIGRGALRNPALFRELNGGEGASNAEIYDFLCRLRSDYSEVLSGQTPLLYKLKEVWSYLFTRYPEKEKLCKKLLKSKSLQEYDVYVKQILF